LQEIGKMARWLILLGILALFAGCALAEQTNAPPLSDKTIDASQIIDDINNKDVKSVNYPGFTIRGTWDFSKLKSREIKKPIEITKSKCGGAPRCKQAGHARRRRMKAELYRSDPFPS